MQHYIHHDEYDTAILIKQSSLQKAHIEDTYIKPSGLKAISMSLDYGGKKKPSAKTIHAYLEQLLPALDKLGIKDLLVCDGEYFKKLTKVTKVDPHYGYVKSVAIKGYEHMNAVLCVNHSALMFNPDMQSKIDLGLQAMTAHKAGNYTAIGSDIIKSEEYPSDLSKIKQWLDTLLILPALTCDIEAFALKHYLAGLGSIGFAWDSGNGISFAVDHSPTEPHEIRVWDKKDEKFKKRIAVAEQVKNEPVRALLKEFFTNYKGKLIWHNASFDITVLIYQLWMNDILDQEGLLEGLDIMTGNHEDTMLITYLATNSCAGNKLSLKDQAHEFAGNYAESDINDIRLIPNDQLLRYNLVDCLCTWYVMDKHYDTMVLDEQYELYQRFKCWQKDIIQMQLTGMCLDMPEVHRAETKLQAIFDRHKNALLADPIIKAFEVRMRKEKWQKDFGDRKAKAVNPDKIQPKELSHFDDESFNPNSGVQLQKLLYEDMGLPVVDTTKTGAPATGGKTLKKLTKLIQDEAALKILNHLRDYAGVAKILSAFIPAFKEAPQGPDGMHYLFGSFNLGGTVSGRLSSKNPNLQQIPSGSDYAKVIKKCFTHPPGFLFVGADFNALEDRINTLLTKDPAKEAVLTQGFDGHMYRAVHYRPENFSWLDFSNLTPEDVNSLVKSYSKARSDSKPVSFALQYQGTWSTLVANCGYSDEEAKAIEANYHKLYAVSAEWTQDKLKQAANKGYAVGAFGLRIRCPILSKSIVGTRVTTAQAAAESRTLGNALSGQSYGMLTCRASSALMQEVREHPVMRKAVRLSVHIHDAIYAYIKDDVEVVEWFNKKLAYHMSWQELPELYHPEITLPAELDIFHPTWADDFTLPNNITQEEIIRVCREENQARLDKEPA